VNGFSKATIGGVVAAAIVGGIGAGTASAAPAASTPAAHAAATTATTAATAAPAATTAQRLRVFADSLPILSTGQFGPSVMGLQIWLHDHGYPELEGTGYFGAETAKDVAAYRHRAGLPSLGRVDRGTWRHIITQPNQLPMNFSNPQLTPGAAIPVGPRRDSFLFMTDALAGSTDWFVTSPVYTRYGGASVNSVKKFQSRVGISATGIFGASTTAAFTRTLAVAGTLASCD
jgi:peptidoglycan hydrolase-like protein with peptidoglycan-binding domain